ncbi:ribosomal subunit interface protein [Nitratireductor aestuarii]|uniref:Ribosome hibernation promoting factor n=1 Tax=Nitratireductor aestuarii TaxID=1735103 RepID=A0A916RLK0_9HYPH|nr:ribosome-associated translation inhibitor RaiA [Nitratireductor aestuarii]GGA58316.1 ribosomal subunit interface protein [Nitratireductor aestuarii]
MTLRISGKHMDVGDAFRTRIESKIGDAVTKYFDGGYNGHVNMIKGAGGFSADCMVRLDSGTELQATGQAQEPQLAFDIASERLEKRLRRYNRRLKSRSYPTSGNGLVDGMDMSYRVMTGLDEDEENEDEGHAPAVVAELRIPLKTMAVATAVMVLDLKDDPVLVFRNASNNEINVVYRRADGNIGWIDPSSSSTQ